MLATIRPGASLRAGRIALEAAFITTAARLEGPVTAVAVLMTVATEPALAELLPRLERLIGRKGPPDPA